MSADDALQGGTDVQYGYARYERSLSDGDYGSSKASLSVPFIIHAEDEVTEVNARVAFIQAKNAIYRELQITTETLEDGTVIEILKAQFKGSTVTAAPSQGARPQQSSQSSQPSAQGGGGTKLKVFKRMEDPRGGVDERGKPNMIGNPSWLMGQIEASNAQQKPITVVNGHYELWDNRPKLPQFGGDGNPKAPWFKDKNGDGNAIWPPKGDPSNDAGWRHECVQGASYEEPF